ncbi:sirohydrochlorin cobaltochelatase [Ectothiorhodospira lacustris]|uniref:sirohydrochlorin cobaltochelatase n=1 Tax=Ectothiorhodospira lacustris TaxID=2899127 RepID=UPI001EE8E243|nr:sirohydrochlorin cobaltochelatase [Ectothiorhodospira lacustris]
MAPRACAVLLVSRGGAGVEASLEGIESAILKQSGGRPLRLLRFSLPAGQGRDDRAVLTRALVDLASEGHTHIRVTGLFVVPGHEYHAMRRTLRAACEAVPGIEVQVSSPLLSTCTSLEVMVKALLEGLPTERLPEEAVIYVGHGHRAGRCDLHYQALAYALNRADPHAHLACLGGGLSFEALRSEILSQGYRRVFLLPLMMSTGGHARRDMAGPAPDSWQSRLEAEGLTCIPVFRGLGEYPGIATWIAGQTLTRDEESVNQPG